MAHLFSSAAQYALSVAAFFLHLFVPACVFDLFLSPWKDTFCRLSGHITIAVEETEGSSLNRMYKAVETYLSSAVVSSASTATRLRVNVPYSDDSDSAEVPSQAVQIKLDRGEEVVDFYKGAKFWWQVAVREFNSQSGFRRTGPTEVKYYKLTFHKQYRDIAIKSYLPHILEQAKVIKDEARTLNLYTNDNDEIWTPVKLRHRTSFDAVVMNEDRKKALVDDLSQFMQCKEYYKSINKAWKRHYFLYGPPGTGKSTLIAAMANFLRFDIFNLELKNVTSNAMLRSLLINTTSRSIIVIEDIDSSVELQQEQKPEPKVEGSPKDDESKVTLSGLLNFVDGLWSGYGDERIIIFMTNYEDKIDPAFLWPGHMDMHIQMGYCDSSGFRVLISNYHSLTDHPLFAEIDRVIDMVTITPAEVSKALMRSDNVDIALEGLMELLTKKKIEDNEMALMALFDLKMKWGTKVLE